MAVYRKEYNRKYYMEHRERCRAIQKKYEESHREQNREHDRKYYIENRDRISETHRAYQKRIRDEVFNAYGGFCCVCCGETTPEFLAIDHVNGGGNKQRKNGIGGGAGLYRWLRNNGYPPNFQVLCHNCNMAKGFYGQCPHQAVAGQTAATVVALRMGRLRT